MKRLVVDNEFWYDMEDTDTVTLDGNPVSAASIDSDNLFMTVSNLSQDKQSKDKKITGAIPTSGKLTNVATF